MSHRFKIGQTVTLAHDRLLHTRGSHFRVVALMPALNDDPQYLVKSDQESCQRVVVQSSMTKVVMDVKGW